MNDRKSTRATPRRHDKHANRVISRARSNELHLTEDSTRTSSMNSLILTQILSGLAWNG